MGSVHSLPSKRQRRLLPALVAFFVLLLVSRLGVRLLVDGLWFQELGQFGVFRIRLLSQSVFGSIGFVAAFIPLWLSLRAALRRSPMPRFGQQPQVDLVLLNLERRLPLLTTLGAAALALGLAVTLGGNWMVLQVFAHRVAYGMADPIFGRDLGFHLFTLPALRLLHGWLLLLVVLMGLSTVGVYIARGGLLEPRGLQRAARGHIGLIAAAFLLLLAAHFFLAQYDILQSDQGVVHGAGYSDVKAALPGLRVLIGATLLGAGLLAYGSVRGQILWVAAGPGLVALVYVLGALVIPASLQNFVVEPNELEKERPYIENALRFTREAYDLAQIEERDFKLEPGQSATILEGHAQTLENVRLWDWRPLLATYRQIQEIRLYYNFGDVDVDRYVIGGRVRQVMLSARELAYDQLHQDARTWVNLHLKYTHGYGLCMSPVNEITAEGLPELFIRDIPPVSTVNLPVTRPEIYFGEQTTEFSLVGTTEDEFDYPTGEANQFTRYQGHGGIPVGSLPRRLLFAWSLGSRELMFTGALKAESRILLHRTLQDRLQRLAPFLRYDQDPYVVLDAGRLFWIVDAYTVSNRFPYSQPEGPLNYIRNSVKVVIDAYHGTTTFYVADERDPLLQVYRKIFPQLFHPLTEMPSGLRAHLRYPVDLFRVQAETYATFHMDDPQVFYNREDLWQLPIESFEGREIVMEPYYTIMRLPETERVEMLLMLPFTPSRKDNMIAWMAARCDGEDLGRRMVFLFPKQELVYGPRQIEARIDQDADISQQLTLWSQRGSNVIRGNLLVLPIGNSVLYVEPLYLRAEKGALPELKRVIVAHGTRIKMEVNLLAALRQLFGESDQFETAAGAALEAPSEAGTVPAPRTSSETPQAGAARALQILDQADAALRQGDWSGYGDAMQRLRQLLQEETAKSGSP